MATETVGPSIEQRTTTTEYTSNGRFPRRITNAAGHTETRVHNPYHGGLQSLTGPNGINTDWTYDAFGRMRTESREDGTATNVVYGWCVDCPSPRAVYSITTSNSGAPTFTEHFDSLNRNVLTQTESFDGRPSNVATQYNALGQTLRVSRPYFGGATPQWTEYGYDLLSRVTREDSSATGLTTTAYRGLTTIVTNARNQVTEETMNARGLTSQTIDAADNVTVYQYDPAGNLQRVTDPSDNVTVNTYDVRGHKIRTDDPDMGVWTYRYNVLGELTEQTDAKGQVSTFEYDNLGRMTRRVESAGTAGALTSTWVYDTAARGIGNLASEATSGFTRTYTYGSLSRPASTTTTIDGVGYLTSLDYDPFSRLAVINYPGGFAVRNRYNPSGYLAEVENAQDTALNYWRGEGADADGQITRERLGNGLTTTRQYDSASGRIDTIMTGVGGAVQDLDYGFDRLGNLARRADLAQGVSETFAYDALNRLTTATTVTGGVTLTKTVGYDALGNITRKTGVGAYSYDPARPHAVSQAGSSTYSYDANGNMRSGAGRTITWSSFNLPVEIRQGATTLSFSYAPDRARYKQVATDASGTETTHYVGSLFERITSNGVTTRRHYIQVMERTVAIHTTRSNGADDTRYLHRDHLGSIDAITNQTGQVVERLSYDGWGRRRPANWTDPVGQLTSTLNRGFTGHEHLDDVGLIHMNGRVFDPQLGRFLSADPFVQFPKASQSFNRYSYVLNNPLSYTDPSGFFIDILDPFEEAFDFVEDAVGEVAQSAIDNLGTIAASVQYSAESGYSFGFNPYVAFAYLAINYAIDLSADDASPVLPMADASVGAAPPMGTPMMAVLGPPRAGMPVAHGTVGDTSDAFQADRLSPQARAVVEGTRSDLSGGKFANGAATESFAYTQGEVTSFDALRNFIGGSGEPLRISFDEIDTSRVRPTDFEAVQRELEVGSRGAVILIDDTLPFSTSNAQRLFLGDITLRLQGALAVSRTGRFQFQGTLRSLNDVYDFNPGRRGFFGEFSTAIGRLIPGRPFIIEIRGSRPISQSGTLQ